MRLSYYPGDKIDSIRSCPSIGAAAQTTDYIDFKALSFKGDPINHGGRFKKLPMGYKAP